MDNELKDNLIKSDLKVRYYEHVKKLLAIRKLLRGYLNTVRSNDFGTKRIGI